MDTWEIENIGLIVIGGEAHKMWWLLQNYVHYFVFNFKELGKLKVQDIHIILDIDTLFFLIGWMTQNGFWLKLKQKNFWR
jgi:hypothetical protein